MLGAQKTWSAGICLLGAVGLMIGCAPTSTAGSSTTVVAATATRPAATATVPPTLPSSPTATRTASPSATPIPPTVTRTAIPSPSAAPSAAVVETRTPVAPTQPRRSGVPQASRGACPAGYPIKGNQGSRSTTDWIYHVPGGGSYAQTDPEECFASEADAQAAGYRRARN
jgi:hypothetical protein